MSELPKGNPIFCFYGKRRLLKSPIIHWKWSRQNPYIEQAKVFLLRWQKQLTKKLNKEDKILAFKSRDLRKNEIEELRKNKVKVNGFGYQGKLLADILEEDLMEAAA